MVKNGLALLFVGLLLAACSGTALSALDVDMLHPASVSYPEQITRIGVIDRAGTLAANDRKNVLAYDSNRFCEVLAQSLADADYFDEVVLCDSNVSALDRKEGYVYPLSPEHVQELAGDLNVDILLGVEYSHAEFLGRNGFSPVAGVETVARLYLPGRKAAIHRIHESDTLVWDAMDGAWTLDHLRQDAMQYLADKVVRQLAPYWKSVTRYYYDGGNADLRDAGVFVRRGDWEQAAAIWERARASANGKQKLQLAYNLIVATEMLRNDVDSALEQCKTLEEESVAYADIHQMVVFYRHVLTQRQADIQRLNLQMHRLR